MAVNRERSTKRKNLYSSVDPEGKLSDIITRLNSYLELWPDAYTVHECGYYDDWSYNLYVDVPETDAEMASRIAQEELTEKQREEYSRKQYEELKKKFG